MKRLMFMLVLLFLAADALALQVSIRPRDIYSGEESEIFVSLRNDDEDDYEDVEVTVYIPELAEHYSSSRFDLDEGDSRTVRLFVEGPQKEGFYPVRISVSGDEISRAKWIWLYFY